MPTITVSVDGSTKSVVVTVKPHLPSTKSYPAPKEVPA